MAKDTAQDKDGMGMSRSQLVAEHLPLLRRYARALTGQQARGDAYVGAMLEALLQDGSLLDQTEGPRAGIFKLFNQIFSDVRMNESRLPEHIAPSPADIDSQNHLSLITL